MIMFKRRIDMLLEDYSTLEEEIEKNTYPFETINKRQLVNIFNYLNFKGDTVVINLRHIHYGNVISLQAYPSVCNDQAIRCVWATKPPVLDIENSYRFLNLVIDRDITLLIVKTDVINITIDCITLAIPEYCEAVLLRRAKRYRCIDVSVDIFQNGMSFQGILYDFSTSAFRVIVSPIFPATFKLIDPKVPVYVIFKKNGEILFSGECKILKSSQGKHERAFVLSQCHVNRVDEDIFENKGYVLKPQPTAVFIHPLINKLIRLDIEELTLSWLIVAEDAKDSVLFPGLVIPELRLEIVPSQSIICRAKVMFKENKYEEEGKIVKWRVRILDMSPEEQVKLVSLLERAEDSRSYVCPEVDLDSLFDFFFTSGFIYPDKYASLAPYKEKFLQTYRKLYLEAPSIAKHFIYQERGKILGHLSMLRFYENTWLVHHHAARGQHFAGTAVLRQIAQYVHECNVFNSSHMDFIICYFRQNNKYPNRVFGGFAKEISNPQICSIDTFAYINFNFKKHSQYFMNNNNLLSLKIKEASEEDLVELSSFYKHLGGGLLIEALDLNPEMLAIDDLSKEYEALGFKRQRKLFSIKKDHQLQAVVMEVISDVGLNMSNLTNCLHIFIIQSNLNPVELFYIISVAFSADYEEDIVPVLIYPLKYVKEHSVPYDKEYNLWCFNTSYTKLFIKYIENLFKWMMKYEK